jgi:hypothetical protein
MPLNTLTVLRRVAPSTHANYMEAFRQGTQLFEKHGITSPQRMAHFLAQVMQETGRLKVLRENMSYSVKRMLEIFGVRYHSAKITPAEAPTLAHHPEALAERVYGLGTRARRVSSATHSLATASATAATASCRRRGGPRTTRSQGALIGQFGSILANQVNQMFREVRF